MILDCGGQDDFIKVILWKDLATGRRKAKTFPNN